MSLPEPSLPEPSLPEPSLPERSLPEPSMAVLLKYFWPRAQEMLFKTTRATDVPVYRRLRSLDQGRVNENIFAHEPN